MIIREASEIDAYQLTFLMKNVEKTSMYMLMNAGERNTNENQMKHLITKIKNKSNSNIIVAEINNVLIGYLFVIGFSEIKKSHSAFIVLGIDESYRNKRVGTSLMKYLMQWFSKTSLVRLELSVISQNKNAIKLYTKFNFLIEGEKLNSIQIDNCFYNEFLMSLVKTH